MKSGKFTDLNEADWDDVINDADSESYEKLIDRYEGEHKFGGVKETYISAEEAMIRSVFKKQH